MVKAALAIRRNEVGLGDGELEWLNLGEEILAFKRPGNFACIVNFGKEFELPDGEVFISSAPVTGNQLPSDAAVWMRLN